MLQAPRRSCDQKEKVHELPRQTDKHMNTIWSYIVAHVFRHRSMLFFSWWPYPLSSCISSRILRSKSQANSRLKHTQVSTMTFISNSLISRLRKRDMSHFFPPLHKKNNRGTQKVTFLKQKTKQ